MIVFGVTLYAVATSLACAIPAKQAFLVQVSPPQWLGTTQGLEASTAQLASLLGTLMGPLLFNHVAGLAIGIGGVLGVLGLAYTAPILKTEWRRLAARAPGET